MSIIKTFLATIVAVGFIASTASAASTPSSLLVNYSGSHYIASDYEHPLALGQHGTVNTAPKTVSVGKKTAIQYDSLSGFLPASSKIVFTFTANNLTSLLNKAATELFGKGSYTEGNKTYSSAITVTNGSYSTSPLTTSKVSALYANINDTTSTITIVNNSSVKAYFLAFLQSTKNIVGLTVQYAVSAVPLPASLQMFLLALVGLGAFAYSKKRANAI